MPRFSPHLHAVTLLALFLTAVSITLPADSFAGTDHIRFASRVAAVGNGWVELERPLRYDVRTAWQVGFGAVGERQHKMIAIQTACIPLLTCRSPTSTSLSPLHNTAVWRA